MEEFYLAPQGPKGGQVVADRPAGARFLGDRAPGSIFGEARSRAPLIPSPKQDGIAREGACIQAARALPSVGAGGLAKRRSGSRQPGIRAAAL